ncbi:PadR family transcriptional regulator [Peptostreptococcus canis]|uniref:PadR family transcriptional regulator n=1 Tax=Peptostreptococcus canis TaxID=1159213 RepID=A0ABR6TL38_9FIRM|nr:PadR family transcriptional regulator [Peptostreptococcus canis]MBC2576119.1 PadR family transcriptional regulator [Peptostreptococcus canis]MBP1997755.1 PadR family transcriptional regulator PadR [Peptostreptococcus canis]
MNTQFRKGALELCVLAMINHKDMYGYEIVQNISKSIEVNEGTIYPILRRLTKDSYFETYMVDSSGGPARKYYKMTNLGQNYFAQQEKEWYDFVEDVDLILRKGKSDE